mgnify:FL=1
MNPWYLLDSGAGDPAWNMAVDEWLLGAMVGLDRPVLRFYGWTQPAASFGYFQRYADVERLTPLRPLVRRPTGGGVVPHDADWTYSLAFPVSAPWYHLTAVESYRRVHAWIGAAFSRLGIATTVAPTPLKAAPGQCFMGYERFDLLCRGRKIAGAAQRRTRTGLLIQGSVQPPPGAPSRQEWQQALCAEAAACGAEGWAPFPADARFEAETRQLALSKYARERYNQKR